MDAKQAAKVLIGSYVGYAILRRIVNGDPDAPVKMPPIRKDSPKCVIVGGGISGICMSIKLAEKGIDHVIIEKEADVGGTWFLSNYPGVQCDVPSHGYCFSFEMNPDWSQAYAGSREIWTYLTRVAKKYGVYERARFNTEVLSSRWIEADRNWVVEVQSKDGKTETIVCDYMISGIGALHFPLYPDVPGIGTLKNGREIHSAEWREDIDYAGKNVVIVGSAASAVQIVPTVAEKAKRVTCIQRTPNWLAPQRSPVLPFSLKYGPFIRWCFRNLPGALLLHRFLIYLTMEGVHYPLNLFSGGYEGSGQQFAKKILTKFMMMQLKGHEELAEKVIPKYAVGCKRIIRSERFLPALLKDNVELVTDRLSKVDETGVAIKTEKGERHIDADLLIYATGYNVGSLGRMQLRGCNDHLATGMTLVEKAVDTFYGLCNPDYPNAFLLLGPNTGLGHNSIIIMIETQANYIARCIELATNAKYNRISVKPEAVDRCMNFVNTTMENTVWKAGHCHSWYQNKDGKVPTVWPATTMKYMHDVAPPNDLNDFDCLARGQARHEVSKM